MDARVREIARAVAYAGGRAYVVGGYVRDHLLDRPCEDVDVEILGLGDEVFEALLAHFGEPFRSGRSFDVLRIRGLDADFSLVEGAGGTPSDFARAALRRDLTINAIALDPLTGEILDPHGGRDDLAAGILRATDPTRFGDDPLRALRVGYFHALLDMRIDPELSELCAAQDLSSISPERVYQEMRKLLLRTDHPSRAFRLLDETRLLRFMPELDALPGVPQDPEWHPEGDVWVHTLMALDQAALLRGSTAQEESHDGDEADDLALMLGTLCHDLGKPLTTETTDGRVRSPNHCRAGLAPTESLLTRWRAPHRLVERVLALVDHHLAPAQFVAQRSGPRGYRRLSRNLERAGVSLELLTRVARADHLGRTTEEALRGEFPDGDRFLARAAELAVERRGPVDVVQGRHLIARGLVPGPEFGSILERCREVQDESGESDPASILDRVLRHD